MRLQSGLPLQKKNNKLWDPEKLKLVEIEKHCCFVLFYW